MIKPTEEFWKIFKETSGALSTAEATAIIQIADLAPKGKYICLGSHKGKDSLAAVQSLKDGVYYLIDPIYEDNNLRRNVEALVTSCCLNNVRVEAIETYSPDALYYKDKWDYIFWDTGSHGGGLPMREAKVIEDKVSRDGIVCLHDFGNQFTEVTEAYYYLISTNKFAPIAINWPMIFEYVKENNLEEGNDSWHKYPELPHPPNFVGALKCVVG